MTQNVSMTIDAMNRLATRFSYFCTALTVVRSSLYALVLVAIWASLRPINPLELTVLGLSTFLSLLLLGKRQRLRPIDRKHVLLSLEMAHPDNQYVATQLKQTYLDNKVALSWQAALARQLAELKSFHQKRTWNLASTLVLPILLLVGLYVQSGDQINAAFRQVGKAVSRLGWGVSLTVIKGYAKEQGDRSIKLVSGKTEVLELLAENMIEIEIIGDRDTAYSVELKKSETSNGPKEIFQSFRLSRANVNENRESEFISRYRVAFSITEPVDLYIPAISSQPLASIYVKQLPIPRVKLQAEIPESESPWPDDQPLPLQIKVTAENPLRLVRLTIQSGKRQSTELVNDILTDDMTELSTQYNLILEPYVESDLAEVEITAEAIDRSVPIPLLGKSEPIVIRTASAYGRYQQSLRTLRRVKSHLDKAIRENLNALEADGFKAMKLAVKQSEKSPFFDNLDRLQINRFDVEVQQLADAWDTSKLLDLSGRMNRFLFEHEVLDDRERDRDFFVAIRGLSRLLELPHNKRMIDTGIVTERIRNFLDTRHERWVKRTARLPNSHQPQSWPKINAKRPFRSAMVTIDTYEQKRTAAANREALMLLSKTATTYRQWIEELETAEDKARAAEEQKRQKGLASARNQLKQLQRRQGQVSQKLDRANIQEIQSLASNWPSTRMQQNTNLRETKSLEAQLRSLAPVAGQRIKAAVDSMSATITAGNARDFTTAETGSDLAGRLLRQADSAAQKAQQPQGGRGRRKRVTGDRYYGRSVVGGDVEFRREYKVDKRYREDILDDVQQTIQGSDQAGERKVLESYLRQVVR